MIKRIILFLLIATAFSLAHASTNSDIRPPYFAKDSVQAEQHASLTQVDFDGYYENLIQSEKNMVKQATTASIIGGVTLGFGIFTTIVAFSDDNNSDKNSWAEIHRQTLQIASVSITTLSVVCIAFNLYTIISQTGEDSKRASYERAYEIYKRRRAEHKDGTKVTLTPVVNLLGNSAGINMDIQF